MSFDLGETGKCVCGHRRASHNHRGECYKCECIEFDWSGHPTLRLNDINDASQSEISSALYNNEFREAQFYYEEDDES